MPNSFPPKGLGHFTLPPALLLIPCLTASLAELVNSKVCKLEHIQSVNHAAQGLDHWTVELQGKTVRKQEADYMGNYYTENT